MFLPCYLKSRAKQFYSGYLPGLLTTGDNKRMSRWEILHRAITRPGKVKLPGLGGCPSFHVLLAPRISRGHFFLVVFFRVTHDGLSERGTTRSLLGACSELYENDILVRSDPPRICEFSRLSQTSVISVPDFALADRVLKIQNGRHKTQITRDQGPCAR